MHLCSQKFLLNPRGRCKSRCWAVCVEKSPVQEVVDTAEPETRKAVKRQHIVHANDGESSLAIKEINPSEVVRGNKFLGCGPFGTWHLAQFRGILVNIKEFTPWQSRLNKEIKQELLNEARMMIHLGDHCGLP